MHSEHKEAIKLQPEILDRIGTKKRTRDDIIWMTTSPTHYHFLSGICRAARFSNGGLEKDSRRSGDYNEIIAEIRAFKRDEATKKLENLHSAERRPGN